MTGKAGKNDKRLGVACIGMGLLLMVCVQLTGRDGAWAVVYVDGSEYGRYPLYKDAEIVIESSGGASNRLVIQDGMADMTEADCPDKLCVKQKPISKQGETIVCLPNKVIVKIEGDIAENELDGVAF